LHTGAQSPPAISLNKITKLYGRFAALREVSVDFDFGKACAIFGDNGAGKSTMLRAIAGLARPTSGTVSFPSITGDPRPSIGYMAHASMLYEEMTGLENMRYFARLYGITDEPLLRDAILKVGLDPDLQRYVGQYSQGMRQRISLARVIVHRPRILLLDEPFSNVDVHSAAQMANLLADMRDEGAAILIITHQPAAVERIADESILMQDGRIVARECGIAAARLTPAAVRA
jgi:ABC-type multidrug transport system ATPase subunit